MPEQLCSARTARAMAMVAWQRASRFSPDTAVFGLGSTAAITTHRDRRGADRCHLAVQSHAASLEINVPLEKHQSRQIQEDICRNIILNTIAETLGLKTPEDPQGIKIQRRRHDASPAWQTLLREAPAYVIAGSGRRPETQQVSKQKIHALLPGTFNPLHHGHIALLDTAREILGTSVFPEISIWNVDKPPLDFLEMQDRQVALGDYDLVFSNAATFEEKSRLFPGATFVLGLDTIVRTTNPRYYGNDAGLRDQAMLKIAARGNKFLVFGRMRGERFETLNQIELPDALRAICTEIPREQFRVDVSSSRLRRERD